MEQRFVVVEFLSEGAVEVVHASWIEKIEDDIYCYWPKSNVSGKVKRCELPDKKYWKRYPVRVISCAVTFERALEKARKAEETSNVETDTEVNPQRHQRPSKKPLRYQDDHSEGPGQADADDEGDDALSTAVSLLADRVSSTSVQRGKENGESETAARPRALLPRPPSVTMPNGFSSRTKPTKNRDSKTPLSTQDDASDNVSQPLDWEDASHISDSRSPGPSTAREWSATPSPATAIARSKSPGPCTSRERSATTGPSTARERSMTPTSSRTHSHDTGALNSIFLRLKSLEEGQQEILRQLRLGQTSSNSRSISDFEDTMPETANDVEQLEELCTKLSSDPTFRKHLVAFLVSLGGCNLGDSVRRMLQKLGTNALWSQYSLKGRKTKRSFLQLSLAKVVIKACMRTHPKAKVSEVEAELGESLKYAPKRKGGPKYKAPASKRRRETNMSPSESESGSEWETREDGFETEEL